MRSPSQDAYRGRQLLIVMWKVALVVAASGIGEPPLQMTGTGKGSP
jgi:hypothetical protein